MKWRVIIIGKNGERIIKEYKSLDDIYDQITIYLAKTDFLQVGIQNIEK